ncbi:hypothetical protein [Paraburkholderia sp. BCC1885]|uniref:hypothetical protein n=1 Tax=Paraburkholderia sp. BCC1885 TaxID=2562669 RepID=UPI00118428B8|nr:hypothetical protein [Paraburkholderia sp. BCC1885]
MFKKLCLAAALVASIAGCTAAQIQTAGANVAAVNGAAAGALQTVATSIVAACPAGEAFASAAAAATALPDVALAEDANGLFCALNKAIVATAPASAPVAASAPASK